MLANHCSDGGTSSNGRRECACNGLKKEEETQEESSAASQRAIANQVVEVVGDCSLAG